MIIVMAFSFGLMFEGVIASEYQIELRFSLISESEIMPFVQIIHDDGKVENIVYDQNSNRSISGSNGIEIERSEDYAKMQGVYTITLPSSSALMYKIWIRNEFSDKVVKSAKGIGSCAVLIKKDNKEIVMISVASPIGDFRSVKYKFAGESKYYTESITATDGVLQLFSIIPESDKVDLDIMSLPYPNVVKGYVWNTFNNTPLNRAEIFVDGTRSALTDSNGNYFADLLGMGDHTVYVRYKGKKSEVVNLSVREVFPLEINFKLNYPVRKQVFVKENLPFEKRYYFLFKYDSAILESKDENRETIAEMMDDLAKYNVVSPVLVMGHTDSDGPEDYNLRLSYRRANAIKEEFQKLNLRQEFIISGKGESEPFVPNDTPENKAKNRRVELEFRYAAGN